MYSKLLKKAGSAVMAAAMAFNALAVGSQFVTAAGENERIEFETADITGEVTVEKDASASGGSYLKMTESGTISLTFNVETTGMYTLTIYGGGIGGAKQQNLSINGASQGVLSLPKSSGFEAVSVPAITLNKGENTLLIEKSWGWSQFDYMTIESASLAPIKATQTTPCDPKATAETRSLMDYLASVYGNNIISGQQEIYSNGPHGIEYEFEYLKNLTDHYPAIRGFDYGNFCCPAYGNDDGSTERVIDWVKTRGGIATSSFHLNVPTDFASYNIGDRIDWSLTTYSQYTDFSPSKAATEGTKENEYYVQALTLLANEFKKLQDQGIPIIWRPLHEAEGGGGETGSWFWWGREGSEAYKKLWIYTYEKLTNDLGCHNLIWEWNSYNFDTSENWYPGDKYVDIIGYDKYNCKVYLEENNWQASLEHNDSAISSTFYSIMEKYNSKKMVAMAENDSFSTVDNLTGEKAGWLYFCTWYDGDGSIDSPKFLTDPIFNTEKDTIDMYQSDYCITLDELPEDLYSREVKVPDPVQTTTTTTSDPSITTTTTTSEFVFEQKSYKIDLPEERNTLTLEIEGAPTASVGGGVGYGTTAADWVNLEWSTNLDKDGKASVVIDISEIPASIKSVEVQIWWSNVWDAAIEDSHDKDCDLVNTSFGTFIPDDDVDYGDSNCDGKIDMSDAVLIMQSLSNPDKYGLKGTDPSHITDQGLKNADCYNTGDGVTNNDALAIQKYKLEIISELPEKE
ncbi:MAG: glycoside hydrolase [Ruminococcus flavefaciens]|nr:glycoside hydrolase [Ruminococcus flavefaciens]MCM1058999.1 glycoside hydrolase [Eubacterium sp.]